MAQDGFASLTLHDTEPPTSAPAKSEWRALSLSAPWWWLMLHLPPEHRKNIENRPPKFSHKSFRGEFLLHAAKSGSKEDFQAATTCAEFYGVPAELLRTMPSIGTISRGGIVGRARITDMLNPDPESCAFWHFPKQLGFVVEDAQPLPFVECRGSLGFWKVPESVIGELREKGAQL